MKTRKVSIVGNWRVYGEKDWSPYSPLVLYVNDRRPDSTEYGLLHSAVNIDYVYQHSAVNIDYVYQLVDYYNSGRIDNGLVYDLAVED